MIQRLTNNRTFQPSTFRHTRVVTSNENVSPVMQYLPVSPVAPKWLNFHITTSKQDSLSLLYVGYSMPKSSSRWGTSILDLLDVRYHYLYCIYKLYYSNCDAGLEIVGRVLQRDRTKDSRSSIIGCSTTLNPWLGLHEQARLQWREICWVHAKIG